MAIYIVRHGETAGNAEGVVQFPDTPLNERGLAQAAALAERLAEDGITRILTSDYARAHTTATTFGQRIGVTPEVREGLRERNFGDLRGRPRSEVGEMMHAEDFEPPNGESWPVFHARVERCWHEVRALGVGLDGNLALFTHGLVCYSLVARQLTVASGGEPVPRGFGNTSVTIVEAAPPWRVALVNCSAHLGADLAARGSVL